MPQSDPQPATPASPPACPEWARTQIERVLRALEGQGPNPDALIRRRSRSALAEIGAELPQDPTLDQVSDHLWAHLLCAGRPGAARFFRPVAGRGTPVLWVRRADGGADGLDRRRVERLLEHRGLPQEGDGLDAARRGRECTRLLRNGLGEAELVRALSLTSPGQAAVLRRLCRGAVSESAVSAVSPA